MGAIKKFPTTIFCTKQSVTITIIDIIYVDVGPHIEILIDITCLFTERVNVIDLHGQRNLNAILLISWHCIHQTECRTAVGITMGSVNTLLTIKESLNSETVAIGKRCFATKTETTNSVITIVTSTAEVRSIQSHALFMRHACAIITNVKVWFQAGREVYFEGLILPTRINMRVISICRQLADNCEDLI